MSNIEQDTRILATFAALLPHLTSRQKENLLFYGEGMAAVKRMEAESTKAKATTGTELPASKINQ